MITNYNVLLKLSKLPSCDKATELAWSREDLLLVDATHFFFSDSNSPLQGIPKYKIRMPCKVLGQSEGYKAIRL